MSGADRPSALIIGGGPAGVSAALYILRAGFGARIVYSGPGSLEKAEKIENYYGFPGGISGRELLEAGRKQAAALGAELIEAEVTGLGWEGRFQAATTAGAMEAEAVVLATGVGRKRPRIDGLDKFDGLGVSWCAACDGFFCRGRHAAVLGASRYAISEAEELLPLAASVTLLTNGEAVPENLPAGLAVDTRPVSALRGGDTLEAIVFADGSERAAERLFIALGVAGGAELAQKTGAAMSGGALQTDEGKATTVPGLFAAGDCAGAPYQVSAAAASGALAGASAAKFLRGLK